MTNCHLVADSQILFVLVPPALSVSERVNDRILSVHNRPFKVFGPVHWSMITGFDILESNSDKVTFWEPGETASIDPIIWIDCFKTWYSRGVVDDRPRKLFLTKLSIAWNTAKKLYRNIQYVTYCTQAKNFGQTK